MTTADWNSSAGLRSVHGTSHGLRPVQGPPETLWPLLLGWLEDGPDPDPLVVRTSGSTGEPKDVLLSACALRASATATARRLGGEGHWLLALPVAHVAGLQVLVRSALAGTPPVLLSDHRDLVEATAALTGRRRYLSVVPTQLHRWVSSVPLAEALRQYDAVLVGGAPIRPELLAEARRQDIAVVTTYGMTETCGGCVYDGVGLDEVAVALDPRGRIRLAGPMLFDGYAGQPDLTAEVLRDGWLITQDLGRLDEDGRLMIVGRVDEVVVSGGVNVSLPAVEACLAAMPRVADAAVVGVPDAEWGTRVVAVLVPAATNAPQLRLREIRDVVAARYPRSWAPRQLLVVPALPLLDAGKVDRTRLVEWAVDSPDERGG